jgi:hypothetical protein
LHEVVLGAAGVMFGKGSVEDGGTQQRRVEVQGNQVQHIDRSNKYHVTRSGHLYEP